ncbi:FadR/GntR family transcriptional regulator [Micromonospora krabiensis]|uniref:DNA-binding transcriptional regulator, FadR family n=1 Tax=Micromonospora krabiensis TaxID=307121 RepID=A0A1C3N036_9ACTN|nr:FadR/GntR family transcriptional regulator [Micromonospora krabiensis]SBV25953.1 DNA-binding transcriptional regulator, FadR family [Micromonospora krabiensis]
MAQYAGRGVHGQTVEVIARRILSGEIAEGATLNLAALQEELDVSLTALREALKVLTAKGIVDARQKRGTFVRPRSDWNLLDGDVIRWQFADGADPRLLDKLQEVRAIIEPAAARLAAARATADDLAVLDAALHDMADAHADPGAAVAADLAFHRALLAATHNELLVRMEVVMETGLAERDRLVHGHGDGHDDPVPSHRAVVDAIRGGDEGAAETAMRELLAKAVRDVEKLREQRSPAAANERAKR